MLVCSVMFAFIKKGVKKINPARTRTWNGSTKNSCVAYYTTGL